MSVGAGGRIGWLGVGKLGLPMAARIKVAGHEIAVCDISPERQEAARARGLDVVASPAEAVTGARAVFTSLPNDNAMLTALTGEGGLISVMPADAILVETSTVSPEASAEVAQAAAARGLAYLRAPVSGNPVLVEAGTASVFVSGPRAAFDEVEPVIAAFTRARAWLGEAEQARYAKLAINLMIAVSSGMLAEAMLLAEKGGISRKDFLDVACDSAVGSPFVKYKAPPLVEDDYTSTFTCVQMIKDIDLILGAAQGVGVPAPLTALMRQSYSSLVSLGHAEDDFIATVKLAELLSGVEGPQKG